MPRREPTPAARAFVRVLAALALALGGLAGAQDDDETLADGGAAPAARLTVIPDGEQRLDLATGETVLPRGGTIVDTETGLELEAATIRYVEGAYIEAERAVARVADGRLEAPTLRVDLGALTAVAPDGVRYDRDGLELVADAARLRFGPQLARFDAPRAEDPDLQARALLLDVRSGDAVLLGPYRFQDGPFTLRDDGEDAVLQLRPVTTDDGVPTYAAANEVDEALWSRLAPLH
jgi:hypothetical protein